MPGQFKFDENLDPRWREPLLAQGYRVSTVEEEHLKGTDDKTLAEICRMSDLCLITADLDFAQPFLYPPGQYAGLIVLRHPRPTLAGMKALTQQIAAALQKHSPVGQLWIIEPGRIRIRGMDKEETEFPRE